MFLNFSFGERFVSFLCKNWYFIWAPPPQLKNILPAKAFFLCPIQFLRRTNILNIFHSQFFKIPHCHKILSKFASLFSVQKFKEIQPIVHAWLMLEGKHSRKISKINDVDLKLLKEKKLRSRLTTQSCSLWLFCWRQLKRRKIKIAGQFIDLFSFAGTKLRILIKVDV